MIIINGLVGEEEFLFQHTKLLPARGAGSGVQMH